MPKDPSIQRSIEDYGLVTENGVEKTVKVSFTTPAGETRWADREFTTAFLCGVPFSPEKTTIQTDTAMFLGNPNEKVACLLSIVGDALYAIAKDYAIEFGAADLPEMYRKLMTQVILEGTRSLEAVLEECFKAEPLA